MVERAKGGVKLFVGRLPLEATSQMLNETFKQFGEVLEVFLIDPARTTKGARCAFVRLESLEAAEKAIAELHEEKILVPERSELGPIQVAFAKGEAVRFGLPPEREQLTSRWQPAPGHSDEHTAPINVDPDTLTKEALVSLIKENQRTGGQPFKQLWWEYCDTGKGGLHDYDPARHTRASLRSFFEQTQLAEWGTKPWFRRALQWVLMGGRAGGLGGKRGRRDDSSSDYSSDSSRSSSSSSSSARRRTNLFRAKQMMLRPVLSGLPVPPMPPPGFRPPVPFGGMLGELPRPMPVATAEAPAAAEAEAPAAGSKPARLLSSAAERDPVVEAFLAEHRISPSTSFLMLKLSKEQAAAVVGHVEEKLKAMEESGQTRTEREAESLTLTKLKALGVRSSSSWTSTERQASPAPLRGTPREGGSDPLGKAFSLQGLPSLDGILGGLDAALGSTTMDGDSAKPSADGSPPLPAGDGAPPPAEEQETPSVVVPRSAKPKSSAKPGALRSGIVVPDEDPDRPPAANGAEIFVKNLDKSIGERELRELFGRHGVVASVEIPQNPETGQGRGHAYILMASREEAERSSSALHFTKPWGRALIVERRKAPGESDEERERAERSKKEAQAVGGTKSAGGKHSKAGGSDGSSSDSSSGWSRYTVRSKKGGKGTKGTKDRKSEDKEESSSSSSSSYESQYSEEEEEAAAPREARVKWPPIPGQPPFPMPGMPGVPPGMVPPWALPWGGMPPMMDERGFPIFDREDAEKQLRAAERRARKELKRRERHSREKNEVWEDHPARRKGGSRSPSRVPQRVRSSSGSGSKGERSKASEGRRRRSRPRTPRFGPRSMPPGNWNLTMSMSPRPGRPVLLPPPPAPPMMIMGGRRGGPPRFSGPRGSSSASLPLPPRFVVSGPRAPGNGKAAAVDTDDSDVDMSKAQEEINFADI